MSKVSGAVIAFWTIVTGSVTVRANLKPRSFSAFF
jgi:hypothetical protein